MTGFARGAVLLMLCTTAGCWRSAPICSDQEPGCDPGSGDADADTDGDADADTDGDADTDTDGDTDTDSDSDTGSGSDSASDTGTQTDSDTWPTAGCVGKEDFTLCAVTTSPDRSYDICVGGRCVSPGCGDTSCNSPGPHFPLADTGVRLCYNDNAQIDCPGNPDAGAGCSTTEFCGQDAQYGWDAAHPATGRFTRDTSVTGQPVVVDNVTGLVWQGCPRGLTGDTCGSGSASYADWPTTLAYCDGLSWGGKTDWRLPDEYELMSIIDYGGSPFVDANAFPAAGNGDCWTSSSCAPDVSWAWQVAFDVNNAVSREHKTGGGLARCVRGEPTPRPSRFTRDTSVPGEPVVADAWTDLEWQGCPWGVTGDACGTGSVEFHDWEQALSYCAGLSWGGQSGWRLPSIVELRSIVDNRRLVPPVDPIAFPGMQGTGFAGYSAALSSSSVVSTVWIQDTINGGVTGAEKPGSYHARCVRGGS